MVYQYQLSMLFLQGWADLNAVFYPQPKVSLYLTLHAYVSSAIYITTMVFLVLSADMYTLFHCVCVCVCVYSV